jgi:hypothetical protein
VGTEGRSFLERSLAVFVKSIGIGSLWIESVAFFFSRFEGRPFPERYPLIQD